MNGVSLSNQVIHWNPKKFAVSRISIKLSRKMKKFSMIITERVIKLKAWTALGGRLI